MHQVTEIARIAHPRRDTTQARAKFVLRCSVLLLALGLGGCGSYNEGKDRSPTENAANAQVRVLRRGIPGDPRTLDPQLADDDFSFQVVRDLYEGLTAEDPYGQIVPGTASTWTVDDTGTVYTFSIRPEARWSNGDRVVAGEFVEGMRRAVDPKTASGSAALLAVVKGASQIIAGQRSVSELGVEAVGDSIVRIHLEHPAPFILQILSQPIAAPLHSSIRASSGPDNTVCNGAYILVKRVPGSTIELAHNSNYWNSSNISIQRVRYINAESQATELREYSAGQLDLTFTIPMPDLPRAIEEFGSEVQMAPTLGTVYLALNLESDPLRSSVDLRKALAIAVDKEQIAEHLMMGATPAYTFVAEGISDYSAPKYEWASWPRERQLAEAQALYERAGYSRKNPLHLRLYYNNSEGIQQIMIAIAGSWKQNLGVVSELNADEFRVFLEGRKDHSRWDVARLGWDADYDDPSSFLEIFSAGSSQNDPSYVSGTFNALLAQARMEPRPAQRASILREAEGVLLNDYPIIPIYFSRGRRLVKAYIGGAHMTPMRRTYTKNLYWQSPGRN
jgi:oligopeptide transport system substrate-binding protein